jgi:hypothetical protein
MLNGIIGLIVFPSSIRKRTIMSQHKVPAQKRYLNLMPCKAIATMA